MGLLFFLFHNKTKPNNSMNNPIILFLLLFISSASFAQTPETVVKASLAAYNERNLDLFMSYFSEDISFSNFTTCESDAEGTDQVRTIFRDFFEASPQLHSRIVNRITFDNKVIDHEHITGARGSKEPFEVVIVYEIKNEKIIKLTAIRKEKK